MRQLQRNSEGKWIAGICGGIGKTYDIDPLVVRLIVIGVTLATGFFPFAITYLVGWIALPDSGLPAPGNEPEESPRLSAEPFTQAPLSSTDESAEAIVPRDTHSSPSQETES